MNSTFKSIIKDYFISISLNDEEISIQIYNISSLDNFKYEINFDLNDMKNISLYLSSFNITGFYEALTKLVKNGKLKLDKQFNNLVLSFLIKDTGVPVNNEAGNKLIQFILFGEQDKNEYLFYLTDEIKKLKQQISQLTSNQNKMNNNMNNIMNNNMNNNMNNQFNPNINTFNKNDIKNPIFSINQSTSSESSNFNFNDYFNRLNVEINDNISKLDLDNKLVDDRIFGYLNNYELNKLVELSLSYNRIKTIQGIENSKFSNLEILILSNNNIINLTYLSKANFPELKRLFLNNNEISDISPLANAKFTKLDVFSLGQNDIVDIYPLKNFKCPELRILQLEKNAISDISVFEYANFKLQRLGLNDNIISNLSALEKANLRELKQLFLYRNSIADTTPLGKANLPKLVLLSLNSNKINSLSFLENNSLKELRELYISDNQISDLSIFTRIECRLTKLFINGNKFDVNNNSQVINSLKSKMLEENFKYSN